MHATGGDPSFLRRFNSSAVLHALYEHGNGADSAGELGGLTVSQLAAAVNVSRPTAEEAAESLHAAGWIDVITPQPGARRSAGRPARRFRFRPTAGYVVGVDVEATSVSSAVADLGGTVLGRDRRPAPPLLPAEDRLELIGESVGAALREAGVESHDILGGVVGSTGVVGPDGRILRNNLPGWQGLHLADEVSRMLAAPVSAYNHVRLSALGERWRGAAQTADDVVHLHAGQRMGVGVVVDGKPLIGAHGAAGELGRAPATAWMHAYRTLLEHPLGVLTPAGSAGVGGDIGDAGPIFDAAMLGDDTARLAVEDFARELIDHVAPIVAAFDPAIVVIGGDLARAGEVTVDPVQRRLDASCPFPPEVRVSELGDDSITLGAIRSALDDVETRIFSDPYQVVSV
ncbi:ROK family transcriptional regulator [Microbacterium thalassium]|uniref:ROK family transcriptional regulator n=1 Tax=Microbacterium TaxID=33882 RepID=UPI00146EC729|nr:ROK family transcriptional regulator [Microbacterium thalassium]